MVMTAEQYEKNDMLNLEQLRESRDFQGSFGISRVQRSLRIGYNRAARLVEAGLKSGLLTRCVHPSRHDQFAEQEE